MEFLLDNTKDKSLWDFGIMIWLMLSSVRRENARKFIEIVLKKCIKFDGPDLGYAIFKRDLAQTSELVTQLEDNNRVTLNSLFKFPILTWAICFGEENSHAIISRLLACKLDVNEKDFYNRTPIHWAIFFNKVTVVSLLIDLGATLDGVDVLGASPIGDALGNVEILNVFICQKCRF